MGRHFMKVDFFIFPNLFRIVTVSRVSLDVVGLSLAVKGSNVNQSKSELP